MNDLRNEIEDYLGNYRSDFDVDAIESALRGRGYEHIDQCDPDEFSELVQRNDTTQAR